MKTKVSNKDKVIKLNDLTLHSKGGDLHWPEDDGGELIATPAEVKAVVDRVKALMAQPVFKPLTISYYGVVVGFNAEEQIVAVGCQQLTFKEVLKLGKDLGLK